mgnify:CR=1 FL=1
MLYSEPEKFSKNVIIIGNSENWRSIFLWNQSFESMEWSVPFFLLHGVVIRTLYTSVGSEGRSLLSRRFLILRRIYGKQRNAAKGTPVKD